MGTALVGFSMPIFWWGCSSSSSSPAPWAGLGLRADLAPLLFPARHRLHADRQPALRPEGRLCLSTVTSHPALDRARDDPARGHRPADPLGHAGSAERGLRAHRSRQGPAARPRRRRPRAAQRAHPGGDHHRPHGRHAARRGDPDRDDLFLARHRQVDGRFDLPPRLSGGAGRPPPDGRRGHGGEPRRRSHLRFHQPRIRKG